MENFFRMEPFALFNLLKSFLPKTENSTLQPQPAPESVQTNLPNEKEISQANPTQNGESYDPPPQNYCLDFIRRHEERAGRKR